MTQSDGLTSYLTSVKRHHPDLAINSAHLNLEGLANAVVIVNDELVFRFPKTDMDREQLIYEAKLLAVLHSYISLPIPVVEEINDDYALQRYLPGIPLYRHNLLRCTAAVQDGYAGSLAKFLFELHSVPLEKLPTPVYLPAKVTMQRRQYFLEQIPIIQDVLYPLLWSDQRAWVEDLFTPLQEGRLDLDSFPTVFTHRDLASYHILHDPATQELTGILDFGTAVPSDPAEDLGMLISIYGEWILRRMRNQYPLDQSLVERARFYAAFLELEWAVRGIKDQNPEWLLVHIGRARDCLPLFSPFD